MGRTWCSCCSKLQESDWNSEGFKCCTWCGKIVQDNAYSDEPTFFKNAAGQTQMSGRFVNSVQKEYSASHERTLNNAYDFIRQMADNLGIDGGHLIVGPAKEFYTIALERNFTRGRRADQVAAACLYITCREQKKAFLLIEFAEFLRVNVYVLGAVFLQLCKLLSLEEHPIVQKPVDPSLFIHRFTNLLLGQTQMDRQVEKTAISIMKSMKRDWMQTGRKPSGLCGAALYISALAHGHKFTKTDIVRIVHICEATLKKRLIEFEDTASGSLTIEELNQNAEELERNLKSNEDASSRHKSETVELLCQHKGSEIPHFAHGLCESCHKEFVEISGGLEGGAEPPAFQHAERERMAKLQKERNRDANTGENVDSGGVGTKDSATGANHDKVGADHASTENGDDSDNLSDIDDAEVDGYLHNEEEKEYKKVIWEEMNREYLEEQAAKEAAAAAAREAEMASFQNCSEDVLAARELAAAVAAKVAKSKKEQREKRAAESKTPQTAAEATHQMLKRKRLSSRVNYDVLKEIFDEPVAPDNTEKTRADEAPKKPDDYWGTTFDEDDYYDRSNAQDHDYHNEEEVYNYDNADDGSWF